MGRATGRDLHIAHCDRGVNVTGIQPSDGQLHAHQDSPGRGCSLRGWLAPGGKRIRCVMVGQCDGGTV